jgi:phosphoglycolate phosphatase-like HAD superfamily hydrolase
MTACRINHLVFWADGILVTPPGQTAWAHIAPGCKPDARARLALHNLEQELADGRLPPAEFCVRALALGKSPLPITSLADGLPEQIAPIPGMPEVLEELACRRYMLSLASGYPRCWLMPALERCGLAHTFREDQVWIAAEWGGFPALLDALLERGGIVPGRSLWVDDHSLRTSAALRRGVDAAVFVHARQFYRDLGLWGLVPFPSSPKPPSLA